MAHKIMVNCGHGTSSNGAWDSGCTYGGYTEAGLMLPITKAAVKYLRSSGITVLSDADTNNNKNMVVDVQWANKEKVELYVSIHCDYSGAPSGVMPLYVSATGKKIATALNNAIKSGMGMKSRGVQKRTDLWELNGTDMPACILETGSIKADLSILKNKADAYGKCIAKGLCTYLGVTFKEPTQTVTKAPAATKAEIYRVRKSWTDVKSQIGAFTDLNHAIALADEKGYNVYNSKGSNVHSGKKETQIYRVRKTWADATSQKGAFQNLSKAKTLCNKYVGYHVYDNSGKSVHTSTKKEAAKPAEDPLKKWYDAMTTQYNWSKKRKYGWATPTVASSKTKGTCVTFVAVSLQRIGLLPSGKWINANPKTGKLNGTGASYVKSHTSNFTILYPKKTIAQLGDKIKKGDIVSYKNPGYHTMVYMGKDKKGNPIFNTMGKKIGLGITRPVYAKRKIDMIVRIKKI